MKIGRLLLYLSILISIFVGLVFFLPDFFSDFKVYMSIIGIILLGLFFYKLLQWRSSLTHEDLSELHDNDLPEKLLCICNSPLTESIEVVLPEGEPSTEIPPAEESIT